MKNILIAILSLWGGIAIAQETVSEDDIAALMKHRTFSCFEVEYNSMQVAEDLYEAGRYDSLNELVVFWQKHCEVNERLFSLIMLNSIRNGTFRERLSENKFLTSRTRTSLSVVDAYRAYILRMLSEYKDGCNGSLSGVPYSKWMNENYRLPKDAYDYFTLYENYYDFLRYMARTERAKKAHTPLEDYLLRFYAGPDSVGYAELDSALYAGTVLQKEYTAYKHYSKVIHGGSYGIQSGAWVPFDGLSQLGTHPYISFNIGGKSYTSAWDLVAGVRFMKAPQPFNVRVDDSLFSSTKFTGWFLGMDVSHTLLLHKRSQFDFLWGVGYESMQLLSVDLYPDEANNDLTTHNVGSFYANVGLGYRFYVRQTVKNNVRKHSYLALQGRYHMADFWNNGGTDLHGNYLTIGLIYGAYSHTFTKYPYLK